MSGSRCSGLVLVVTLRQNSGRDDHLGVFFHANQPCERRWLPGPEGVRGEKTGQLLIPLERPFQLTNTDDAQSFRRTVFFEVARGFIRNHDLIKSAGLDVGAYAAILTIQLQALTDLLAAERGGTINRADGEEPTRPEQLEDELLGHEQRYWEDTAAREGLVKPTYQPVTLRRAVAIATVCGAADEDEAIATVTRVPGLGDKTSDERRGVAGWLADLYPASERRYWGSLQPDRVGEHLIGQVTHATPNLLCAVLDGATEEQLTLALTVLSRAVIHQPHLADSLRELLTTQLPVVGPLAIPVAIAAAHAEPVIDALRAAALAASDPEALLPVHDALPPRSMLLGSFSLDLTTRLIELYRPLSESEPDAFLPQLAMSLNNQSNRLSDLGRREEALAAIEEAVTIRRRLADARPDAFLPDLASALNNQSSRLGDLGRREEALAAIEEAVQLVLPMLERASYVLPDSGLRLVQRYVELCERVETEPDEDLLQRMYTVLLSAGILSPDEDEE